MAVEWFCEISGRQLGPLSPSQLRKLVNQGKLGVEDRVRQGSDGAWVIAGRVKGLFPKQQVAAKRSAASKQVKASRAVKTASKLPQAESAPPRSKKVSAVRAIRDEDIPQSQASSRPPLPPPVAQAAAAPVPPAAAAGPAADGGFPVVANGGAPVARAAGQSGGHATPRKRGKQNTVVVIGLVVLVMGLAITGVALWALSGDGDGQAEEQVAASTDSPSKPAEDAEDLDDLDSDKPAPVASPTVEPAAEPAPATSGSAPDDSKYIDASKLPQSRGPVDVRIASAAQGVPPLRRRVVGAGDPPKSLLINVLLKNRDADLKLEYTSWGSVAARGMQLRDDKGRKYRLVDLGRAVPEGALRGRTTIYPDAPVEDVLIFERPMPGVQSLYLDLPVTVFQPREKLAGKEPFHLRIPASMIGTIEKPAEPATRPPVQRPPVAGDEVGRPIGTGHPELDAINDEPESPPVERPKDDPFAETEKPAEQPSEPDPPARDGNDAPSIFDDEPDLRGEDDSGRPAKGFEGEFNEKFGPTGPTPPARGQRR